MSLYLPGSSATTVSSSSPPKSTHAPFLRYLLMTASPALIAAARHLTSFVTVYISAKSSACHKHFLRSSEPRSLDPTCIKFFVRITAEQVPAKFGPRKTCAWPDLRR